jgi:hypothetical protein
MDQSTKKQEQAVGFADFEGEGDMFLRNSGISATLQ